MRVLQTHCVYKLEALWSSAQRRVPARPCHPPALSSEQVAWLPPSSEPEELCLVHLSLLVTKQVLWPRRGGEQLFIEFLFRLGLAICFLKILIHRNPSM